jgi:quercetin dioxygenase-like cupin family protein
MWNHADIIYAGHFFLTSHGHFHKLGAHRVTSGDFTEETMPTFYDDWLGYWDDVQERRAKARKCIHEENLEWVRTKQDYRAALLCSRKNGFATSGDIMLAEVPANWNTGKHCHGEEAIYIIEGAGFSVIDGKKYEWDTGSCIFIPFGVSHQHFNTGSRTVRYISVMALSLEKFAGISRIIQHEEASEIFMGKTNGMEPADSDIHPEYGRIVLKSKDAAVTSGKDTVRLYAQRTDEHAMSGSKQMRDLSLNTPAHRARNIHLMTPENGFKSREANITGVLIDEAGKHSGKHAHMEALLYVLQGEGYSILDEEKVTWKKGSFLHITGPQTVHQHFNTGETESHQLRIHYGLRSHFFSAITKTAFPYLYYEFSSYGKTDT